MVGGRSGGGASGAAADPDDFWSGGEGRHQSGAATEPRRAALRVEHHQRAAGVSARPQSCVNGVDLSCRRMGSEYVYQSLDQPSEVVTPCCGSLGIFGVRLFVDKDDIEIRVVAELPTAEFAVSNDTSGKGYPSNKNS